MNTTSISIVINCNILIVSENWESIVASLLQGWVLQIKRKIKQHLFTFSDLEVL